MNKAAIYKEYGIEYKAGKIVSPVGMIGPLLVDGNTKIGKGVYHFSTLAGSKEYTANVNGETVLVNGTCAGNCENGYCMRGNYNYQSCIDALAVRTIIAREHTEFCKAAVMAQIKADDIKTIRIHATGDFFSKAYLQMWIDIVAANPGTIFWTYTKEKAAENAFDRFENANIVKSTINGAENMNGATAGYNFGHIDYVIAIYNMLKDMGKSVYICRCGIDKNQHCTNCTACAKCEHVLFVEHSTGYNAAKDLHYNEIVSLIESQDKSFISC